MLIPNIQLKFHLYYINYLPYCHNSIQLCLGKAFSENINTQNPLTCIMETYNKNQCVMLGQHFLASLKALTVRYKVPLTTSDATATRTGCGSLIFLVTADTYKNMLNNQCSKCQYTYMLKLLYHRI